MVVLVVQQEGGPHGGDPQHKAQDANDQRGGGDDVRIAQLLDEGGAVGEDGKRIKSPVGPMSTVRKAEDTNCGTMMLQGESIISSLVYPARQWAMV